MKRCIIRMDAHQKGLLGEYFVLIWLWLQGYRILSHRFKCRVGEIDLISRRKNMITFIEIKFHKSHSSGLYAVTQKSQNRYRNAAAYWLKKNPKYMNYTMRFDVVVLSSISQIYHLKNV